MASQLDEFERLCSLRVDLISTLETSSLLEAPERFQQLVVRAMSLLGLDDSDVADKLPVNRSAVNRWRNGNAVPLPMMRKPIYKLLLRRTNAALHS